MRPLPLLAGSCILGILGGVLGATLAGSGNGESDGRNDAGAVDPGDVLARVDRLEARVAAFAAAQRAPRRSEARTVPTDPARLVGGVPPESGDPARSETAADTTAGEGIDGAALRSLEERIAALERSAGGTRIPDDLSQLSAGESRALVTSLMGEGRYSDAVRVADAAAQRGGLGDDDRVDIEMQAGFAFRQLGRHADAEARFRDTLGRTSDASPKASWLRFQIGWERSFQKDPAGAAAEMERAADDPSAEPLVRAHAVYNAARFAGETGEPARARALWERFLRDHAADLPASQLAMKTEAERNVAALDRK